MKTLNKKKLCFSYFAIHFVMLLKLSWIRKECVCCQSQKKKKNKKEQGDEKQRKTG